MRPEAIDPDRVQSILRKHHAEKWGLIPVLQEIQENFGYIPPQTIEPVANALRIYPSQVQGVVTFYAGLSTEPKGRYVIRVCRGTACHVKGGRSVLQFVKRELGLNEGETTPDYLFTLETVACLGACFLAPTMMINKTYYGRLTPAKIASILNQYGKREKE
ncbi:MAG: NADH-quinone oxidoreductase subunit NuoE [Deltaproteobacteria bacterium HGW-Deltaproteobacteria-15]|nr:MAG: NADH-quinone oxidoreductase subunit NuoE [Deltaproteobacteria bacterium HGW-Deltaproteobacteria-15]